LSRLYTSWFADKASVLVIPSEARDLGSERDRQEPGFLAAFAPNARSEVVREADVAKQPFYSLFRVCRSLLLNDMTHKITLIPGDGIGPEVTQATVRILEATGVKFEWETFMAGAEAFEKYKEYIPKELTESIERTHVALKGPVTTPIGGGFASINVALRQKFELYANFRPIRNLPHIPTRYPDVDLIIVRENTESLYSGIEHEVVPGVVESIKIITEKASTRIARFAFEYARKNNRKKIHAIHKANIMKLSDGLFLRCARSVAKDYPEITYGEHIVDNTCMQLVMNPYQYDMLVMENLYGDIISDLCAAFVGGLGFVPSANLGDHCAIFEAVHGSAPDIAGKNLANPTAILRSALLMLRHLGEYDAALRIRNALEKVYRTRDKLTRDVGGKAGTSEFADFIIEAMATETGAQAPAVSSQASI
jgi:isocitrate dehydrogenase (NAD+)